MPWRPAVAPHLRMGSELIAPETEQEIGGIASRMSQQQYRHRTREQVARFFDGTDLAERGLVRVEAWRPESGLGDDVGHKR